jgi:DNA-binding response OmpR family regulator
MFSQFHDTDIKCGYIGLNDRQYDVLRRMLSANEITLRNAMSFAGFNSLSYAEAESYDIIFVDIEGLGGLDRAIDPLANLRLDNPTVPVVMISDQFSRDDFGTSRQTLGDVSLRSPVLYPSLELSLFEALENNKSWQENVFYHVKDIAA